MAGQLMDDNKFVMNHTYTVYTPQTKASKNEGGCKNFVWSNIPLAGGVIYNGITVMSKG